tara:strand:- start:651 stop:881 length:231 start_codon:yes stop_codon:yes gene_type:complete
MKDITPLKFTEKLKLIFFSALGMFITSLWFFGGFIGAVIAAIRGELLSLVLSIFIPMYGALYTIFVIIGSFFGLIF